MITKQVAIASLALASLFGLIWLFAETLGSGVR